MPRKNFLWAACGRIAGSDDDSVMVIEATSEKQATSRAKTEIRSWACEGQLKSAKAEYGDDVFVTSIFKIGEILPNGLVKRQ